MRTRILFTLALLSLTIIGKAQINAIDSTIFSGKIENDEYQIWIDMNLYQNNIIVPGWEIIGEVPGYLGGKRDSRKWIFTNAEIEQNVAKLTITNDYGSEDLIATLTYQGNGIYILEKESGSTMKIVVNRKWVKLPSKLSFIKK